MPGSATALLLEQHVDPQFLAETQRESLLRYAPAIRCDAQYRRRRPPTSSPLHQVTPVGSRGAAHRDPGRAIGDNHVDRARPSPRSSTMRPAMAAVVGDVRARNRRRRDAETRGMQADTPARKELSPEDMLRDCEETWPDAVNSARAPGFVHWTLGQRRWRPGPSALDMVARLPRYFPSARLTGRLPPAAREAFPPVVV